MRQTVWSLLLTLCLTCVFSIPAAASGVPEGDGRISGNNEGDEIVLDAIDDGATGDGADGVPVAAPQETTIARYVYACPGNTYLVDPPVNEACEAAVQGCTDDVEARQYFRWTTRIMSGQPVPPPGPAWTIAGTVCIAPAEAQQAEVTVTLADFRRLPLPPATPAIQPAGGEALIRMRTNAYVDPQSTQPQTFDITLLDTPVQVRATPTTYTWDFGDGSNPLTTEDPGAPYPDLTTWHEYQAPGTVQITLTTTYTGEYSVAGGPWTPIPGTAQVQSEPQPLQLLTTTNKLTG